MRLTFLEYIGVYMDFFSIAPSLEIVHIYVILCIYLIILAVFLPKHHVYDYFSKCK